MRHVLLAGLVLASATPLVAQEFCTEDVGVVPPCLVGIWSGSNDMVERLDQLFANLPADVAAAARPSSGQYLFLRVAEDGAFVTSPMNAAVDLTFFSSRGAADEMMVAVDTFGLAGYFTIGSDDAISYCRASSGPDTVTIAGDGEGGPFSMQSPVPGGPSSPVAMRYECGGDTLKMFLDLPPPIGTVTYDMTKIDESAIPADILDIMLGD